MSPKINGVIDALTPRDGDEANAIIDALDAMLFQAGELTTHDGMPPIPAPNSVVLARRIRQRQIEALAHAVEGQ